MAMHGAHILMVVAFAGSISAAAAGPAAVGTWEGEAICTVSGSPCHDEHVQYRVTADKDNAARLTIAADKIVNGSPVFMGTVICDYQPTQSTLICTGNTPKQDLWEFHISGDTMTGTLKVGAEKKLFRRISVKKK